MDFMEILGSRSGETTMNSLGNTVLRRGKRQGAGGGEQGEDKETVYSGTTDRGGKVKGQGKNNDSSGGVKHKKNKDKVAAEQALGALGRTRAPFIADESVIALVDDTTLLADSVSEPSVEVTMEEWPSKAGTGGPLYGHEGWVAGGDAGDLDEESGAKAPQTQAADASAADLGQHLRSKVASKQNERASQGGAVLVRGKKRIAAKKVVAARKGGTGEQNLEREPAKRKRDDFALPSEFSSDTEEGQAREEDLGNPSGGAGAKAGSAQESSGNVNRTARGTGGGAKNGADNPGGDGAGQEGGGGGSSAIGAKNRSGGRGGAGSNLRRSDGGAGSSQGGTGYGDVVSGSKQVKPKVPLFDERVSWSDLKLERRTAVKSKKAAVREQAGTDRKTRRDFDDAVDELRNANPLQLGVGENGVKRMVIWGRKSALTAMEGVGLTVETWAEYGEEEQDGLLELALDWLEEQKPKDRHPFDDGGKLGAASGGANNADAGSFGGLSSPGLVQAEVEGEEDGEASKTNESEGARGSSKDNALEQGDDGGRQTGSDGEESNEGEEGEEGELTQLQKRRRIRLGEGLARRVGVRRERREEDRLQRSEKRKQQKEEERAAQARIAPPKSVGRTKKAAELEAHRRATKEREKGRSVARELVGEALKQHQRSRAGEDLTADERELAQFAKTLSPVKLLGAGFRVAADGDDDIVLPSEDEDAIDELIEETGCERERAREALELSCDWTANGRPSRVKAARWLNEQQEQRLESESEQSQPDEPEVECVGMTSPRGTRRPASVAAGERRGTGKAGTALGEVNKEEVPRERRSKLCESANRKPVQSKYGRMKEADLAEEGGRSDGNSGSNSSSSSEGLVSDFSSSESESGSSNSESSQEGGKAGQKRASTGGASLFSRSRERSREGEAKRASRYVRQLALALKIDASWAREIYDECVAQGTPSYDELLQHFYRREVRQAKGTQQETTRSLGGEPQRSSATGGDINVNMPTFQLPEWGPGQPPGGGVHFSTLQKMLEAYEKYDKQTNFMTQVTFKSMVKDVMKPNFESKCKLPETVWLPPREDDWKRIADGKPERGGWSDLRFLRRVRRTLRPKGSTNYEIAFESMILRHRGNEEQLSVNLDLWGTKWLAKEREAADEGKALPALKMKSYFKKAVAGVPRFRRWLEGRTFISCKDWYGVLCRKLHRSLGQHAEAAYDKEREGEGRERGEYIRGGGAYRGGHGGEGGGSTRGGGAYRGGRGGPTAGATTGPSRSSPWSRNFEKKSDGDAGARANAHTAGVGLPPHSGGVEPMESANPRFPDRTRGSPKGGRGGQKGSPGRFGQSDRSGRQVNPVAEESREKLPKGPRWHDSKMTSCGCRDPDCGTRQDVPYCQGCGMHGHDRPFCFKSGEPMFNPSGYWCVNKPNERPIEGLGRRQQQDRSSFATGRSNMMDASGQQ